MYSTLTEVVFGRLSDSRSNSGNRGMIESRVLSSKKLLMSYFRFYLPTVCSDRKQSTAIEETDRVLHKMEEEQGWTKSKDLFNL